jgi:S1-C subfamily serine protease
MTDTGKSSGVLAALSDELAAAVTRAGAAVVSVDARRQRPATGIVWPQGAGIVVTADHVIEREQDIAVILPEGKKVAATLAGRDPGTDVAVLRLGEGTAPAPAELAPPDSLKVGHIVLALGRPSGTIMASFGIVSALGGTWRTERGGIVEGYVRADVTLYPGFSGGPLVDVQGRVAGLNSYYLARGQELAIPSRALGAIVQTLLTQGRVRRAYLGVTTQPVRLPDALRQALAMQQRTGLMIVGVESGSPAEKAGLLLGDVLVALAGHAVETPEDLQAALSPTLVNQPTGAVIIRGGQRQEVSVTPGERS